VTDDDDVDGARCVVRPTSACEGLLLDQTEPPSSTPGRRPIVYPGDDL